MYFDVSCKVFVNHIKDEVTKNATQYSFVTVYIQQTRTQLKLVYVQLSSWTFAVKTPCEILKIYITL